MELSTAEYATVLKTLLHSSAYITDSALAKELQQAVQILKSTSDKQTKPTGGSSVDRVRIRGPDKVKELFEMLGLTKLSFSYRN